MATECPMRSPAACRRPWVSMTSVRSGCPQAACVMIALPLGIPGVLNPTNPDMESHSCLARRGTLVDKHQPLADYPGTRLVGLRSICAGPLPHSASDPYRIIVSQALRARQGSNYAKPTLLIVI